MEMPVCPKCQSNKYSREKRMDGDTTCLDCGHKDKSSEWDKSAPDMVALRSMIGTASDQSFQNMIKQQRGQLDDKFIGMLESSEFFKGMFNEAFVAGMHYGKVLDKQNIVFVRG